MCTVLSFFSHWQTNCRCWIAKTRAQLFHTEICSTICMNRIHENAVKRLKNGKFKTFRCLQSPRRLFFTINFISIQTQTSLKYITGAAMEWGERGILCCKCEISVGCTLLMSTTKRNFSHRKINHRRRLPFLYPFSSIHNAQIMHLGMINEREFVVTQNFHKECVRAAK